MPLLRLTLPALALVLALGCDDVLLGQSDEPRPEPPTSPSPADYHPEGFSDPLVHGPEAKLQVQACRSCHGDALDGAAGPACESCHGAGWMENCQWCHGSDATGMPPRDIDDNDDPATISFPAHAAHMAPVYMPPQSCSLCHLTPTSALSPGHLFVDDDTPGFAEVRFDTGRIGAGAYADGSCTVYCHGNGRDEGTMTVSSPRPNCNGCHDYRDDGRLLSGEHEEHLKEGIGCHECHAATVDDRFRLIDLSLHINGVPDLLLPEGMARDAAGCTGSCHGERHNGRDWE